MTGGGGKAPPSASPSYKRGGNHLLYNDPKTFREDMLKGYVAAYPDYVVEVPGGVARATNMP